MSDLVSITRLTVKDSRGASKSIKSSTGKSEVASIPPHMRKNKAPDGANGDAPDEPEASGLSNSQDLNDSVAGSLDHPVAPDSRGVACGPNNWDSASHAASFKTLVNNRGPGNENADEAVARESQLKEIDVVNIREVREILQSHIMNHVHGSEIKGADVMTAMLESLKMHDDATASAELEEDANAKLAPYIRHCQVREILWKQDELNDPKATYPEIILREMSELQFGEYYDKICKLHRDRWIEIHELVGKLVRMEHELDIPDKSRHPVAELLAMPRPEFDQIYKKVSSAYINNQTVSIKYLEKFREQEGYNKIKVPTVPTEVEPLKEKDFSSEWGDIDFNDTEVDDVSGNDSGKPGIPPRFRR